VKRIKTVAAFLRYNALQIFGERFVVFLGLALGLFFLVLFIGLLGRGGAPNSERLYNYLLAPGILLVFYPSVYGIQRDQDTRMVETLFGIPGLPLQSLVDTTGDALHHHRRYDIRPGSPLQDHPGRLPRLAYGLSCYDAGNLPGEPGLFHLRPVHQRQCHCRNYGYFSHVLLGAGG